MLYFNSTSSSDTHSSSLHEFQRDTKFHELPLRAFSNEFLKKIGEYRNLGKKINSCTFFPGHRKTFPLPCRKSFLFLKKQTGTEPFISQESDFF